jgi:hypothetical protein
MTNALNHSDIKIPEVYTPGILISGKSYIYFRLEQEAETDVKHVSIFTMCQLCRKHC